MNPADIVEFQLLASNNLDGVCAYKSANQSFLIIIKWEMNEQNVTKSKYVRQIPRKSGEYESREDGCQD